MRSLLIYSLCSLTWALQACSSVSELRTQPASRLETFAGRFDELANCVAEAADSSESTPIAAPLVRIDQKTSTARVFKESQGIGVYDLTFRQIEKASVEVQGRGMATLHGSDYHLAKLWPLINSCSAAVSSSTTAPDSAKR